MFQPIWKSEGILGSFAGGQPINIKLTAIPVAPATQVFYMLLSGNLPAGLDTDPIRLSMDGKILGTPKNIPSQKTFVFTIRAYDELNNIVDRTFEIILIGSENPKITLSSGNILTTPDSTYVNRSITYSNPVTTNKVTFHLSSGSLPPGLYLTLDGYIKGYPDKPKLPDDSPTLKTYTFSVQLKSMLGDDLAIYSITVFNQNLTQPPNLRIPAILNFNPIREPISTIDPYYDYYLIGGKTIPTVSANEYFSFKVIGYDFENNDLVYQFNGLPPGLVGNNSTGWITGVPIMPGTGITKYRIEVSVAKKNNFQILSDYAVFYIIVKNGILEDVTFITPSDLGVIYNGDTSYINIQAKSALPLNYRVVGGTLPPNLYLNDLGELIGRVAQQTESKITNQGDSNVYKFKIEAYNPDYPLLKKQQDFTLTVYQYYEDPFENIYFKALTNFDGKKIIKNLLTDDSLIPKDYLYRSTDPKFGKAKDVSFVHMYGIKSSNIEDYINSVQTNHYTKKIVLGELKTAVATDDNGNIIYEVVYSKIIDDLTDENDVSVSKSIVWPRNISLREGAWTINNTSISSNTNKININKSPGSVRELYPASLENMRKEVNSIIQQNTDYRLLPKWMITQQEDSNTLGFLQAWVICYTKPGYSKIIKDRIDNNWKHKLNEIEFIIDRYLIDKSATYDYNTILEHPAWVNLPSATPTPEPLNINDLSVLFARKTILPRDYEQ